MSKQVSTQTCFKFLPQYQFLGLPLFSIACFCLQLWNLLYISKYEPFLNLVWLHHWRCSKAYIFVWFHNASFIIGVVVADGRDSSSTCFSTFNRKCSHLSYIALFTQPPAKKASEKILAVLLRLHSPISIPYSTGATPREFMSKYE